MFGGYVGRKQLLRNNFLLMTRMTLHMKSHVSSHHIFYSCSHPHTLVRHVRLHCRFCRFRISTGAVECRDPLYHPSYQLDGSYYDTLLSTPWYVHSRHVTYSRMIRMIVARDAYREQISLGIKRKTGLEMGQRFKSAKNRSIFC